MSVGSIVSTWERVMTSGRSVRAYLVNVDENDGLDRLVLEDLSDDTSVTSSDDKDVLGVGVRSHGDVGDHLLVTAYARRKERDVSRIKPKVRRHPVKCAQERS